MDGYEFIGWNTDKDATIGLSTLRMSANDITLYAIYKKVINISYISNGAVMYKTYGSTLGPSMCLPSSQGQNFNRWVNAATGYTVSGNTQVTSNMTLISNWFSASVVYRCWINQVGQYLEMDQYDGKGMGNACNVSCNYFGLTPSWTYNGVNVDCNCVSGSTVVYSGFCDYRY